MTAKRFGFTAAMLLGMLVASGCSAAAVPADTAQATLPAEEITAAPPCPLAQNMQIYTNKDKGFCVLIPADFSVQHVDAYAGEFVGPAQEGDIAQLGWVEVSDAQGKSAAESAAPAIAEVNALGGKPAESKSITIDGEDAVVVDGLPGQDVTRKVFVVHGGSLYVMSFTPTDPQYKHYDLVQALYEAMVASFTFLK